MPPGFLNADLVINAIAGTDDDDDKDKVEDDDDAETAAGAAEDSADNAEIADKTCPAEGSLSTAGCDSTDDNDEDDEDVVVPLAKGS